MCPCIFKNPVCETSEVIQWLLSLLSRRHSPAALVVEKEHEVEFLFCFVLHLLADAEHVRGGRGDGHPVVLAARSRHVGVDDLPTAGGDGGGGEVWLGLPDAQLTFYAHMGGTNACTHRSLQDIPRNSCRNTATKWTKEERTAHSPLKKQKTTTIFSSWKRNKSQLRSIVSQGEEIKKRQDEIKTGVDGCHVFSPASTHQSRVGRVSTTFGPN